MTYTPEQLYNLYHRKIMYHVKNVHVRNVKNYDKIKASPDWVYFENFTKRVNKNMGQLNPDLYIDSLIDFYDGYFNLQLLTHLKGIKIYRLYIKQQNINCNKDEVKTNIKQGIDFIVDYMVENSMNDIYEYVNEGKDIYPTLAKHFYSGKISLQLLVLIPDMKIIIQNYPKDIINQFFDNILLEYDNIRKNLISYPKLKKISDNFETIIKNMINKRNLGLKSRNK